MRGLGLSLGVLLLGLAGPAQAAEDCSEPFLMAAKLPRGDFGGDYRGLKRVAPEIAPCEGSPADICKVVDPWGYTDTFSEVQRWPLFTGPKRRLLLDRTAYRAQHARLPYGVLWSDTAPGVVRKVTAAGAAGYRAPALQGEHVDVGGCWRDKRGLGFLSEFNFNAAGRLQSMVRTDRSD